MGSIFKKFENTRGFTIAEVIIVLGIIGIIALNTLPVLLTDLNNNILAQSKELVLKKITEATNEMKTNDVLDGYATTDAFVDVFQKYIKVIKRCVSPNLNECFTPKFTTASTNEEIDVSSLTSSKSLSATYNSSIVGLQLINGTNIILAFDPNCKRIEFWNNTTSTTSCIAMLYDINGFKAPNKLQKDIWTLNATISSCDGTKIGGLCVESGDVTYTPISEEPYLYDMNYWAGARNACASRGMRLPTKDELTAMFSHGAELGMTTDTRNFYWSITESGETSAWYQDFNSDYVNGYGVKYTNYFKARCVK